MFSWGYEGPGVQFVHGVRFADPETASEPPNPVPILLRFMCHSLVDEVPDHGLADMCESLREFREFYLPPAIDTRLLPTERAITGKLGPRYERPEFRVDEE